MIGSLGSQSSSGRGATALSQPQSVGRSESGAQSGEEGLQDPYSIVHPEQDFAVRDALTASAKVLREEDASLREDRQTDAGNLWKLETLSDCTMEGDVDFTEGSMLDRLSEHRGLAGLSESPDIDEEIRTMGHAADKLNSITDLEDFEKDGELLLASVKSRLQEPQRTGPSAEFSDLREHPLSRRQGDSAKKTSKLPSKSAGVSEEARYVFTCVLPEHRAQNPLFPLLLLLNYPSLTPSFLPSTTHKPLTPMPLAQFKFHRLPPH